MAATTAQQQELREKVSALIQFRFEGDYRKAFDHYDSRQKDGKIDKVELKRLLADAGVGSWLTRDAWADGIITALDTDQDGTISSVEFEKTLQESS